MKRNSLYAVVLLLAAQPYVASADPAAFLGVSYTLGGDFAVTAKVLSSNKEDNGILAVGASWYPMSRKRFGLDLGAGYAGKESAILFGWDFLQQKAQISAGWADTKRKKKEPVAAAPAPEPEPEPPIEE
jgi:hypothetical protein